MTYQLLSVVGTRPNFVKLAPLDRVFEASGKIDHRIVHTGQHYAPALSGDFLKSLGLKKSLRNLEVGSGPHGAQTGWIMEALEEECSRERPDLMLVVGDVNSTLAGALVAAKLHIPVAHVESGLRSKDRKMPEEINRLVTDRLSDILFVSEPSGVEHLRAEGVDPEAIHLVGNVMIDSLLHCLPAARERDVMSRLGVSRGAYGVVTLHRPSNVDEPERLVRLTRSLESLGHSLPLLYPVHPRTRVRLEECGIEVDSKSGLRLIDPLDYLDFLSLLEGAKLVLTDSGGIQEETTFLGIPCLTLRPNTERPITLEVGTNRLVRIEELESCFQRVLADEWNKGSVPELWDGKTAERILVQLEIFLGSRC
ncbi:MAG: UDP-N-acetylglucosamine 2-epimerase (non-hydrolyzing) [Planctomycetota bacterium]|nr:UDP-N-acetylglucosamine 2-epimerase (non-hydrolyzing) [Planctomycetota bacterium]